MIQILSPLPIVGACAAMGGLSLVAWLCFRRLEQHGVDQFEDRLLRQAAGWLSAHWSVPERTLIQALKRPCKSGTSWRTLLEDLLRIEFEVTTDGWRDCDVRVHIAVWEQGVVKVATIASRGELDCLPNYVRRQLLARYDPPATFVLWTHDPEIDPQTKTNIGATA